MEFEQQDMGNILGITNKEYIKRAKTLKRILMEQQDFKKTFEELMRQEKLGKKSFLFGYIFGRIIATNEQLVRLQQRGLL